MFFLDTGIEGIEPVEYTRYRRYRGIVRRRYRRYRSYQRYRRYCLIQEFLNYSKLFRFVSCLCHYFILRTDKLNKYGSSIANTVVILVSERREWNMNLKNVKHLTEKKRVLFCSVKLVLFFSSSFRLFNKSLYSNPHSLNYMFLMPAQLPS